MAAVEQFGHRSGASTTDLPTNAGEKAMTVTVGLLVRLEAKPGKEQELADFLKSVLPLARAEEKTVTWYSFRVSEREFGFYDTFESEEGRQAHLDGRMPKALAEVAPRLLAGDPEIFHL
jgi:quinol monooxygenase YgiN